MPATLSRRVIRHRNTVRLAQVSRTEVPAWIAIDRFWAARNAGDRRAMTYWSEREIALRGHADGPTLPSALTLMGWRRVSPGSA